MDAINTNTQMPGAAVSEISQQDKPLEEVNGRVLGKVDLPPPSPTFSCVVCDSNGAPIREGKAIVPNFSFIGEKLRRRVLLEDLKDFVVCRTHANDLEDRGIECHWYRKSVQTLQEWAAVHKRVDAFIGDYGKKPTAPRREDATPLKTRPMEGLGKGRDFDSPAASKQKGKKPNNGGHRDKNRRGWADHEK